MPIALLLPLVMFAAMVIAMVLVLRRVGMVLEETRDSALFRQSVQELAGRVDATLADVIPRIDSLRRQQTGADELVDPVERALAALASQGEEARRLEGPVSLDGPRLAFAAEVERAERALEMVEHGTALMNTVRNLQRYGEAETAIKRGYLNALHAREAIARHSLAFAQPLARTPARPRGRRRPTGVA